METVPLATPSPARKRKNRGEESPIFKNLWNSDCDKMTDKKNDKVFEQRRNQPSCSSASAPESSTSSSMQADEDCEIIEKPRHHRKALSMEASQREAFDQQVSDRQQFMRQLIVDKQFLSDRENGGIEKRKAELKDGQVRVLL